MIKQLIINYFLSFNKFIGGKITDDKILNAKVKKRKGKAVFHQILDYDIIIGDQQSKIHHLQMLLAKKTHKF
jgi:hypothetical protein